MERTIIHAEIEERIHKLDHAELEELVGYINHIEEVKTLTKTKQIAMNEIQAALKNGYTF